MQPVPQSIDYQTPGAVRSRDPMFWYRIALACGGIPLVAGTIVFIAWWVTRDDTIAMFGLFTIIGGLGLFIVGLFAMVAFAYAAREGRRPWVMRTALAFVLLNVNFPVCWIYNYLADSWDIRIVNSSSATIRSCIVSDPAGNTWEFGPIAPGATAQRRIMFQGEGAVRFNATEPGMGVNGDVDGYISGGGFGKAKTVTIRADGSFVVK